MPGIPTLNLEQATLGIITALEKEDTAMRHVFGCYEDVPVHASVDGAGHKYYLVDVPTQNGNSVVVAIGTLVFMGTNSAAIRATQMLQDCPNVRRIIMAGIAGAVPNLLKAEDHVRLGDIVISNETGVIQYDLQKETDEQTISRGQPKAPSAMLLEAAQGIPKGRTRGPHAWEAQITAACRELGEGWGRPDVSEDRCEDTSLNAGEVPAATAHPFDEERTPGQPRVFFGPIASANTLLKKAARRDELREKWQVKAVEMEGAGIAAATFLSESSYLVVRGTCDYCDREKGDKWQKYAAVIAAVFTRNIVIRLGGRPASAAPGGNEAAAGAPSTGTIYAPPPTVVSIQAAAGSVVQYVTGGQVSSSITIQQQPPAPVADPAAETLRQIQSLVGRLEERFPIPVQNDPGPSEQDLDDYRQRANDDMTRMKKARLTHEYDEVTKLSAKSESWLLGHRPHLPAELFDEAWWELISCETFRQDVLRSRGVKWDRSVLDRLMKELGHA